MSHDRDLIVRVASLELRTPLIAASGCYGYGEEFTAVDDGGSLGAVSVKGTSLEPRAGNPPPRLVETPGGLLNCVGLQNPGIEYFVNRAMPSLRQRPYKTVLNVAGHTASDYVAVAERVAQVPGIAALELNLSCPNVARGGMTLGTDPESVRAVVEAVRRVTDRLIIAKLSPNVTDITEIAAAAEAGGADAVSLINTLLAMVIDVEHRRPVLGNTFGGLSGPAVRPVAVRMVWQVFERVDLPIIGGGGIVSARDVLEFMLAGATAVQLGTGLFLNPRLPATIVRELRDYLGRHGHSSVMELVGLAHRHGAGRDQDEN